PPEDGAGSWPENWKLAIPLGVCSDGLLVIVTVGGAVSTFQPHEATDETLVATSTAMTSKVCMPSSKPVYVFGESHVVSVAPSSAHSYARGPEPPESLGDTARSPPPPPGPNSNVADVLFVAVSGPELMSGAAGEDVSTVQVREAGVGSVLPLESVAAT